jgi:bifunctional DNA-binding transcriptional regulator/antitoxin component of YhaV-PrlF toxin-antitoxin module
VVIPKEIRGTLKLTPGQKVQAILYGNPHRVDSRPADQEDEGILEGNRHLRAS